MQVIYALYISLHDGIVQYFLIGPSHYFKRITVRLSLLQKIMDTTINFIRGTNKVLFANILTRNIVFKFHFQWDEVIWCSLLEA